MNLRKIKGFAIYEMLQHSKNYFISNVATKGLALISVPIMTRILMPSDYGVLSLFNGYQSVFVAVLTLNCYTALGRYFFDAKGDFEDFFGTTIIFNLSLLGLYLILFLVFKSDIVKILRLPENTIVFIVPAVITYSISSWYEQFYSSLKRSKHIAYRNVFIAYFTFGLSVLLIMIRKDDRYLGSLQASLIIGILSSIYYFRLLRSDINLVFKKTHLKYMMSYSIPLLPYTLSYVILGQIDRIMIGNFSGTSSVGLYSFAYNIGMLLTLVTSAIFQAWQPDFFTHMNDKNYSKIDADAEFIFKIILGCSLPLIFLGKEIGMILGGKNFQESLYLVPIIVIGYVFNSIFSFYAWGMGYAKKNIYLTLSVGIPALINIILNYFLIPRFGYSSAAYATTISYIVMSAFSWFVLKHLVKIHAIPLGKIYIHVIKIIPFLLTYFLYIKYISLNFLSDIVLKIVIILIFFSILFYKDFKKTFLKGV